MAVKRLLDYFIETFPSRRWLVVEDALAVNGPHLKTLAAHELDFIVGVNPGNSSVFDAEIFRRHSAGELLEWQSELGEHGSVCGNRFATDVPVNARHAHLLVNYLKW